MLKTIRVLRVFVGLVAIWQVLGLLPVFTWLPNLHTVTVDMWMKVAIKSFVMVLCGGIYFWFGKIKNRIDNSGKTTSEGRAIIFAVLAIFVIGIALSIIIPALSDRGQEVASFSSRPTQTTATISRSTSVRPESKAPSEVDFFLLMAPPHISEQEGYKIIIQKHPDAIQIAGSDEFKSWVLNNPQTWDAVISGHSPDSHGLVFVFDSFKSRQQSQR